MLDDKQIRAIMQDAAEDVPSRVWEAVSSRLDAAKAAAVPATGAVRPAASTGKARVWKWAGAALAMAAAFAAALFFKGTADRTPGIEVVPSVKAPSMLARALSEPEITIPMVSTPAPVSALSEDIVPSAVASESATDVSESAASAQAPSAPASPSVNTADKTTDKTADASRITGKVTGSSETPSTAGNAGTVEPDPFAAMRLAEARSAASRVSGITFGGSMGGNNVLKQSVSKMSSGFGTVSPVDRITESGNSNFGIPFTLGVGVRFGLTPKLSLGTGLDYSLLTRTFDGTFTPAGSTQYLTGEVRNAMHYIGIPLHLYYNIAETPFIKFYLYGGGEAEYCVANKFVFRAAGHDPKTLTEKVNNIQFSAGLGLGVQFRLADRVGLYLDPGVNYYFYCSQPKSVRTEHPLMFNFNAGLRFDLK